MSRIRSPFTASRPAGVSSRRTSDISQPPPSYPERVSVRKYITPCQWCTSAVVTRRRHVSRHFATKHESFLSLSLSVSVLGSCETRVPVATVSPFLRICPGKSNSNANSCNVFASVVPRDAKCGRMNKSPNAPRPNDVSFIRTKMQN